MITTQEEMKKLRIRIEKKQGWSDETTHVYTYEKSRLAIEVSAKGTVLIRDLKGRLIHINHLLDLIDIDKLIAHEQEYENHAQEVTA